MSHPCRNYCSQWTGEQCKGCMISDETDFAVGDLVVFDDSDCFPSTLMSVTEITKFSVCLSNSMSLGHDLEWLRLATPAEKAAGHRIDTPTVCIEQETLELFNSKHCSPRNYNNDSALRVSEIKASVAYSKMALTNFTLSEKNSRLKTNNHALKAALAVAIVAGVVGWML